MPDQPTPTPKVQMDPNFEKRYREGMQHAKDYYPPGQKGQQVKWERPENYDADLTDWEGMAKPFDRDKTNQSFVEAVKDPENPGTTGDLVIATTMIDALAVMERGFRQRHTMSRCRATAQMLGRKRGHGTEYGPFIQQGIEYVRNMLKMSSRPQ